MPLNFLRFVLFLFRFADGKDFSNTPVILRGDKSVFYDDIGLTLDTLLDLKAIGLIEYEPSSSAFSESPL